MSHLVICADHIYKKNNWKTRVTFSVLEEDHLHDILPEKVTTSLVLSIPTFPFIRRLRVLAGFRNWHLKEAPLAQTCAWGFQLDVPVSVYSAELFSLIVFDLSSFNGNAWNKSTYGTKGLMSKRKKKKQTWHVSHCCDMMYSMRVPGVVIRYLQGSELLLSWRKLKKMSD